MKRVPISKTFLTIICLMLLPIFVVALMPSDSLGEHHDAYKAKYTADGALIHPDNWREWIYIGTPVTPNALNDGQAPFPEVHSVYIDPVSWEHWKKTGKFREGTMIAKELSAGIQGGSREQFGIRLVNSMFAGFPP